MSLTQKLNRETFPIRTVSALTGINPVTLRTWERRYHLIEPIRTPKGHRLYSKEQIEMLQKVVTLLDNGIPISRINFDLITGDQDSNHKDEFWARLIARMVQAIGKFDESRLENTYNEALALYPIETVTQKLLMPMLNTIGERWANGECTVAEEHFFGVYLRNKLGARFHHRKRLEQGPTLITACMTGEKHEAGILLFALSAYDHGYRCIMLGTELPLEELSSAVMQSGADAIVLSASFSQDISILRSGLTKLCRQTQVPVFIGGLSSIVFADTIRESGAIPLGVDIDSSFKEISRHLAAS